MARKPKEESEMAEDQTQAAEIENAAEEVEAAELPIVPGTVSVDNAVTEEDLRRRVSAMAKGRKSYELCGVLRASPSTISNFLKGKSGATKQMLEGLGVEEVSTYVIKDQARFDNPTA